MRVSLVLVVAAACGSTPPQPTIVATRPVPVAPPAVATCAEVGVILRGAIDSTEKLAGPEREVAIATACAKDKWGPEIMSCLSGSADSEACLEKLTEAQHTAYDDALAAWNETYGGVEGGEEGGGVEAPDEYVDCAVAIGDVASYAPAISLTGDDRAFAVAMRTVAVTHECNDGWENDARVCFQNAHDAAAVTACVATLETTQRASLAAKLVESDTLMTKTVAARKKPAAIDCKKVVAARYGDAMWKDKIAVVKGADRKKAIESSRTKMTAACTAEKWSPTSRACLISGGEDACGIKLTTWGYPATGVLVPTGIPECDAYGAALAQLDKCGQLPAESRDAIYESFTSILTILADATPELKTSMAESCKAAATAVAQVCKP